MMFWRWWYREATASLWRYLVRLSQYLADFFSVRLCLSTIFAVWRRDELGGENLSIQERFYVWTLNCASRLVGFFVKMVILISFCIFYLAFWLVGIALLIFYFAFPVFLLLMVVFSVWQLFQLFI